MVSSKLLFLTFGARFPSLHVTTQPFPSRQDRGPLRTQGEFPQPSHDRPPACCSLEHTRTPLVVISPRSSAESSITTERCQRHTQRPISVSDASLYGFNITRNFNSLIATGDYRTQAQSNLALVIGVFSVGNENNSPPVLTNSGRGDAWPSGTLLRNWADREQGSTRGGGTNEDAIPARGLLNGVSKRDPDSESEFKIMKSPELRINVRYTS